MKDVYHILADRREKSPLPFPSHLVVTDTRGHPRPTTVKLEVEYATLPYADYVLAEDPQGVLVERKASVVEVAGNVMSDHKRANLIAEFQNLRTHSRIPVLLFESTPLSLKDKSSHCPHPPQVPLDILLSLLVQYGICPIFTPATTISHRRATAELVARMMIQSSLHPSPSR